MSTVVAAACSLLLLLSTTLAASTEIERDVDLDVDPLLVPGLLRPARRSSSSGGSRSTRRALRAVPGTDAAVAEAAASNSSSPSSPSSDPFARTRVVACRQTAYNGTVIGGDSCVTQEGASWVDPNAEGGSFEVTFVPTESECCALCRTRAPPNIDEPPEKACVFTFCEVGPGIRVPGQCDDGFGNRMRDGECRTALLTLPLDPQTVPPASAGFPPPSANLVSGSAAAGLLLPFKTMPPPAGYRAVGPVRIPGAFNGGCDYTTDDLLRKSIARPECVANVSSVEEAARICNSMKGCTALSYYPANGVPILRAYTTSSAFRDVANKDFGAQEPGQRKAGSKLRSLAVFKYGAIDKRCLTPSPYTFMYVQKNAPRPPGLLQSDLQFEEQQEAMRAERDKQKAGVAAGVAVALAAVLAAVAGFVFVTVRRRRRREQQLSGKGGGGGGCGGNVTSAFAAAGAAGAAPALKSVTGSAAARSARFYSKKSSLEKLVHSAAVSRRKMRPINEGGAGARNPKSKDDNGCGASDSDSDDDSIDEEWEIKLSEVEIVTRPGEDGKESTPWILGAGASGNVYRGRLNGLQDVAVKIFLDQFDDACAAEAASLDYSDDDDHGSDDDGSKEPKPSEQELEVRRAKRRAEAVAHAEAAAKKRHDALRREVVILKSLRDPNIVRFIGANVRRGTTVLVTEWCPRGDLYRALQRDSAGGSGRFTWTPSYVKVGDGETRRRPGTGLNFSIAADIGRGLAYLHGRGLAHLDIKSPNILLSDSWRALIADVGLARVLAHDDDRDGCGDVEKGEPIADKNSSPSVLTRTASGCSFAWAAPEQLLGRRVTAKSDLYSLGTVLWELSTGEPAPASRRLRLLEVPEEAPATVAEMIDRCLDEDPRKRPTAKELVDFFARALTELDAANGVRSAARFLARASTAVGGGSGSASATSADGGSAGTTSAVAEPLGETLARVSRIASQRVSSAALSEGEMFALPPGAGVAARIARKASEEGSEGGRGGGSSVGESGNRSGSASLHPRVPEESREEAWPS